MLQIRGVVYVSVCFFLVYNSIHMKQVLGQYGDDFGPIEEDDETTTFNQDQQTELVTPEVNPEPDQKAEDTVDQQQPATEQQPDKTQDISPEPTEKTQDEIKTTKRSFPSFFDGFGGQWSTNKFNYTIKEEKKLTPELVEKFTMPLLENRWKWDHKREALVKNFWFASFNEKNRKPFRTAPTTTLIPLTKEEEADFLKPLVELGWLKVHASNTLKRDFEFPDFRQAFSFMAQVALLSERIGHFPDWYNFENWVKITLISKTVKGLTRKDIAIAQFASRVYDRMMGEGKVPEKFQ